MEFVYNGFYVHIHVEKIWQMKKLVAFIFYIFIYVRN